MTLPSLTLPVGTPFFLVDGHELQEAPPFESMPVSRGAPRARRTRTNIERAVNVRMLLSAAQMLAVHEWFEDTILVGSLSFSARIAGRAAARTQWWECRWAAPPAFDLISKGRGYLSGTLFLIGEPSDEGPDRSTLGVEFEAALDCTPANPSLAVGLAVEFVAALYGPASLAVEFVAALISSAASLELREDGGLELREDGGVELREVT